MVKAFMAGILTVSSSLAYAVDFEYIYGVTELVEMSVGADYLRPANENLKFADFRLRGRTRFFEKEQFPIGLGLYTEARFIDEPKGTVEGELKGIVEKDFGPFTLSINPTFGRKINGEVDEGFEVSYTASLGCELSRVLYPHLDFFDNFNSDKKSLISPAIDVRLARQFTIGAQVAWGLTDAAEKYIFGSKLEYEF